MSDMEEFEEFCTRLHGLTKKEIYEITVSRLESLEKLQKSGDARRRKQKREIVMEYIPDYSSEISQLKRLLQNVVHGGYANNTTDEENRLFNEIIRNRRS
jgi:DNA helicase IV